MLQALKDLAKKLPPSLLLKSYYTWYAATSLRRAETARRRLGLPRLGGCEIARQKASDTLFVLGSGPSINQIPADRWQAISRYDTVGFNWWIIHPFVPKFYFLEAWGREEGRDPFARYVETVNRRAYDYRNTIKIAMEMDKPGELTVDAVSPEFLQSMFVAYNLPVAARTEEELATALNYLHRKGAFRQTNRFSFLLKYAASLTTLLIFAYRMAYKRVVLCGIDLKTSEYFYQDASRFPEWAGVEYHPRQTRHSTDVRLTWRVPVSDSVMIIKSVLYDPAGLELYVEDSSSALWPRLQQAPASIFEA